MTGTTPTGVGVLRRRTSFVGRRDELASLVERLDVAPAVTLVGPGGVGKTRLAYEAATSVEGSLGHAVHAVELAATVEDDAVDRVVADAFVLPVTADQSPAEAIVARLSGEGPVLVVLDNCEQVVTGVARLVDVLLDRCPQLTVLATSRVPLGVDGEVTWPVEPLASDDTDGRNAPAVELLVERAHAAHPQALDGADPEHLAALARRLDGVPLAIELAAARLGAMDLPDLLDQLDDHLLDLESPRRGAVERHRSLAGVVEWSFRLLDDEARRLATSLSVFRGSFSRDAAVAVLGLDDARALDRLVEVSLLSVTGRGKGSRLVMLEMIREFLNARLKADGRAEEVCAAHAVWAAELVTGLRPEIRGPQEAQARAELTAELANVGAALQWAAGAGDTGLLVTLVLGLHDHVLAGGGREVQAWIRTGVEAVWDDPRGGDVLLTAAIAAMVAGDITRYRQVMEQADALGVEGGEVVMPRQLEWCSLLIFEGDVEEALAIAQAWPDELPENAWRAAHVLMRLAQPFAYGGADDEALRRSEQSLALARETGNPTAVAWSAYIYGESLVGIEPAAAIASYHEALDQARAVGNTFVAGLVSVALASAQGRHGSPVEALRQFRETIEVWRAAGGWSFLSTTLRNCGELLVRLDRPEDAVVVRCALEHLEASSAAGGVDAERDRYLRRLLTERLGRTRLEDLEEQSHELDRDGVVARALAAIDAELAERTRQARFRVIVFTDLERSTQFMADSGDAEARRAMRAYEERTDAVLAQHRGELVKGTGDGVLATFASVADALACVIDLAGELDRAVTAGELPMRLRVGMHAGETIADRGDVHGTVVNLTARVVDRADGGEILVTDTIRQIAVGSDHAFEPLGEFDLKGIPEPMRLYRLSWR